jgi:hypothetical protein
MRMFSKIIGLVLSMTLMTQLAAAQDGGAAGDRISKKPPVFHTISGAATLTYQSGHEYKTDTEFTMVYTGLDGIGVQRRPYITETVMLRYVFGTQKTVTLVGERMLGKVSDGSGDRTNYEVVLKGPVQESSSPVEGSSLIQARLRYSVDRITQMPIWSTAVFEKVIYSNDMVNPSGFIALSLPLQPK